MSDTPIDINAFCAKPADTPVGRLWLYRPLHAGEWSVATNGHIAIRVPRIAGFPDTDVDQVGYIFGLFNEHRTDDMGELPLFTPPKGTRYCGWCSGSGFEPEAFVDGHTSGPCCECGGTRVEPLIDSTSVGICETILAATYFEMIRSLPFPRLSYGSLAGAGVRQTKVSFSFDGGIGLLMPRLQPNETHVHLHRPGSQKSGDADV